MYTRDDETLSLRMCGVQAAFAVIKTLCELADEDERGRDDILHGVGIVCDASDREAAEIIEEMLKPSRGEAPRSCPSPQRPAGTASSSDGESGQPADSGDVGVGWAPYQVRGRDWTLERLLLWSDHMDRYLERCTEPELFDRWRAEIADARPGIKTTDCWVAIRARLIAHWMLLGTSYARNVWMRDWYRRLLAPRPDGWPPE